tara:strand:- start:53 stop:1825 length:1773 start_codon:yes stop_codon:yes gene_type:complete
MTSSFNWTSTFGSSQDPGIERRDRETLEREKELQRLIEDEKEEEQILTDNAERIRQKDLEENPPLENLEYEGLETKSEHWLLKGLGWVGDRFDDLDRAAGIGEFNVYNARQKILKPLSETHVALGILGEFFVPDTVDIATLGLAYIPKRFAKIPKVWAKLVRAANPDAVRAILRGDDMLVDAATGMRINAGDFSDIGKIDNSVMMSKGSGGNPGFLSDYRNRPPAIKIDGSSFEDISKQLDEVAEELGYKSPSSKTSIKLIQKKSKHGIPQDINSLYIAHQEAFWKHIEHLKEADSSLNINMSIFPSIIHEGNIYRPKPVTSKKYGRHFTTELEISRIQHHQKGDSARIGRLSELDKQTGFSAKDFAARKPELLEKWNELVRARGAKEFKLGDMHLDHRDPVALTEAYGKGLSSRNKTIVYNHISLNGGMLGNDPDNAELLTTSLHLSKQSRLEKALAALNHRSAKSFKGDEAARVKYYTTPLKRSGLTPIQEYLREVNKVNEWAMDEMINIINLAPVIKPGKLKDLPTKDYNRLVEMLGGGKEGVENLKELANRLYRDMEEMRKSGKPFTEDLIYESFLEELMYFERGK